VSTFVLITPAKNEEKNIEQTILAVAAQTLQPAECIFSVGK